MTLRSAQMAETLFSRSSHKRPIAPFSLRAAHSVWLVATVLLPFSRRSLIQPVTWVHCGALQGTCFRLCSAPGRVLASPVVRSWKLQDVAARLLVVTGPAE
jgi:hypothetical protein